MFGWEFPPYNSGGLGVACSGLARALAKENVDILFVLPKTLDILEPSIRFLFAGLENIKFKGAKTGLSPYKTASQYSRWKKLGVDDIYGDDLFAEVLRYAALVPGLIAGEEFDIIHAHDWLSFPAGIEAKRISGKPLIVHVHATGFDQGGGVHADSRVWRIEKEGMEEADAIIAVSEFTKRMIVDRYGINPEKIHVVYNGIDVDLHGAEGGVFQNVRNFGLKIPGYKIVLYVGRLTLQKGPDYFLRAAKRVLEENPKTFFVIAGSGDMERQMIRLSAELGIAQNVFFTGFVRGGDLERLYHAADLFVLPSVSEPFGITPLESLIADTPVLLSKQSGVSEVISHALKVDFWDVDEMANKIVSVLRYPPLKNELRRGGKQEALSLTWQKAAAKCVMLYKRIVDILSKPE